MELKTTDGDSLMTVERIARDGNSLVIHGQIMGALPVRAVLTPAEARKALRLLDWKTIAFAAGMVLRRGK